MMLLLFTFTLGAAAAYLLLPPLFIFAMSLLRIRDARDTPRF